MLTSIHSLYQVAYYIKRFDKYSKSAVKNTLTLVKSQKKMDDCGSNSLDEFVQTQ